MDAADADRGVDPAGGLAGNLDSRFANPELHTQIRVSRLGNQLSYPEIDCGACYGGQLDAPVQLQVVQVTFVHFHMQALSATADDDIDVIDIAIATQPVALALNFELYHQLISCGAYDRHFADASIQTYFLNAADIEAMVADLRICCMNGTGR